MLPISRYETDDDGGENVERKKERNIMKLVIVNNSAECRSGTRRVCLDFADCQERSQHVRPLALRALSIPDHAITMINVLTL